MFVWRSILLQRSEFHFTGLLKGIFRERPGLGMGNVDRLLNESATIYKRQEASSASFCNTS